MNSLMSIIGNWIQIVDDKNEITVADYDYSTGIIEGTTDNHCVPCVSFNRCWFKNEKGKKPEINALIMAGIIRQIDTNDDTLFHKWCHCKEIPLPPLSTKDIDIIVPNGKFDYMFESKAGWIKAMGYDPSDRNKFIDELKEKTKEGYISGDYTIEKCTKYGVKIKVYFVVDGINEKAGSHYPLKGSYMVFPNGKIKINTPIGGWKNEILR